MANNSRQHGNTLVLVLVLIGVVAVLIAFFVLNYGQLAGVQKQAGTATDSAAFAAATDMQRIVVDSPLGRIALVDDSPADNAPSGGVANNRPIIGFNTLMATLRLDAIIAGGMTVTGTAASRYQATTGNTTIVYAIKKDLNLLLGPGGIGQVLATTITNAASGTTVYDKYGLPINMLTDAQNAYTANPAGKLANSPASAPVTITPVYGFQPAPSPAQPTITPTPGAGAANSGDPATQGLAAYNPYNPSDPTTVYTGGASGTPGSKLSFYFVPLASQMSIVAPQTTKGQGQYYATSPTPSGIFIPPSIVAVSVAQTASGLGQSTTTTTTSKGQTTYAVKGNSGTLSTLSFVECGGTPFVAPSGALLVSFASGGIPGTTGMGAVTGAPSSGIDFSTVSNIAAGSMEDATSGSATPNVACGNDEQTVLGSSAMLQTSSMSINSSEASCPWVQSSANTWYAASKGPNPGGGLLVQEAYRPAVINQSNNNPSVALSFCVYDWLKSLGLRPNIPSVVSALNFSSPSPVTSFYNLESQVLGGSYSTSPINFSGSAIEQQSDNRQADNSWIQPAYAQASPGVPGTTASMLNIGMGDVTKDPRYLANLNVDQQSRQQANVWGFVPAQPTVSDRAFCLKMVNGKPETFTGGNLQSVFDLWFAVKNTMTYADQTHQNAATIVFALAKNLSAQNPSFASTVQQQITLQQQLDTATAGGGGDPQAIQAQLNQVNSSLNALSKASTQQVYLKAPKLKAALINSRYTVKTMEAILQNIKALCTTIIEYTPTHFSLGGSDFYPVSQAATKVALGAGQAAPTGQDPAAGADDWCSPLVGQDQPSINVYKHTSAPVIGSAGNHGEGSWATPAMAQQYAQAATAGNPYDALKFTFYLTGTDPGKGTANLIVGSNQFVAEDTLQGQQLYQHSQALITNLEEVNINNLGIPCKGGGGTPCIYSYTVWQVQARDEFANGYGSVSATQATNTTTNSYFADLTAKGGASLTNTTWCGSSASSSAAYPQCPALVAEWQLTCPVPVTSLGPSATYHPQNVVSSSTTSYVTLVCPDYLSEILGMSAGQQAAMESSPGWQMNALMAHGTTNPYALSDSGYLTTTTTTTTAAYWSMDGLYYYYGSIPGAEAAGNGWSVRTSAYSTTVSSSGPGGPWIDDAAS